MSTLRRARRTSWVRACATSNCVSKLPWIPGRTLRRARRTPRVGNRNFHRHGLWRKPWCQQLPGRVESLQQDSSTDGIGFIDSFVRMPLPLKVSPASLRSLLSSKVKFRPNKWETSSWRKSQLTSMAIIEVPPMQVTFYAVRAVLSK